MLAASSTLLAPGPARADLIVSVESVTANAGSTSDALDITLTNTGPSAVTVGGFSFGVSVATTNITLTQANISTTAPYIFDGNSLFGPMINTFTGQSLIASDLFAISGSGTTLGAGADVGLGHLLFDVSQTASSGPVTVSLASFPTTSLSDASGHDIIINSLNDGTITIQSFTPVPEPPALVLAITGISAIALYLWRSGKAKRDIPITGRRVGGLGSFP